MKWSRAVSEAGEDAASDLGTAARDELADLWYDLDEARRSAIRGDWSMDCDNKVRRIVALARLIGATSWERVPTTLLLAGTYQGILSEAGLPFVPPDMDRVREVQRVLARA